MSRSGLRPGAAAMFAATLAVAVASVPVSAGLEPWFDTLLWPLNGVVLGLGGLLVRTALPRHPIGRLLTAFGALSAVVELLEGYGYHSSWPGAAVLDQAAVLGGTFNATALTLPLLLFPTGTLPGPRWRPVLWATLGGIALVVLGTALDQDAVMAVGQVLWLISLLGTVASLVVRYRRAGSVERRQLKWVAYAVGLLGVVGTFAIFFYLTSFLVEVAITLVVPLVPAAICVALLRYRLYDVDVLITRTLVYLGLTALLAVTYLATALALGAAAGSTTSSWVTAASTLAAAALFLPARRRLQNVVDRRFRRDRHEALARVDTFLADLRAGRADVAGLEPLLREILDAPDLTLHYALPETPRDQGIPPGNSLITERVGRRGAEVRRAEVRRAEVRRAGVLLAEVELAEPAPEYLDDVLARAGLAIEIGRLLAEVSGSRARIAAAGLAERRRLERDLHDGAQQRLVGVGLALRHAQHRADDDVARLLDQAVDEVGVAIQELRELANGVRPSLLDEGLDVALRDLARRVPLPVEVTAEVGTLPPDVATTAWFVVSEALANVVKHARATSVRVTAGTRDGTLELSVVDDGIGGAVRLHGLADRVGAHGGTLALLSVAGAGTTVDVRLPCGS